MISLSDRLEIDDVYRRYVWHLDIGDIESVVATFTDDAVVSDMNGRLWDAASGGARGFATHFLTMPDRRGGQHLVQINDMRPLADGSIVVKAYWSTMRWDVDDQGEGLPYQNRIGTYRDHFVRSGGEWLCREKLVGIWNDATARTTPGIML